MIHRQLHTMQGWGSGESTRLAPMWPGFDCQIWRHMCFEFVGSLLCTESFSPGTPVSPLLKNQQFDLICVNRLFQFTVSPISAPALERLDTSIKFVSFPYHRNIVRNMTCFAMTKSKNMIIVIVRGGSYYSSS